MNSRIYVGYIIVAVALGGAIFFYEMQVNNEPLLKVTPNSALSTTTFADISSSTTATTSISAIQPLSLLVASTSAEQELGLGQRNSLPADEGMLFIFPMPGDYAFWMKDMHFSIDMIWMDSHFAITHIAADVSPETYPKSFAPGADSSYVLETNAGYSQKNNLSVGESLDFVKNFVEKTQ